MKYIERLTEVNADKELYDSGYRVDFTELEFALISAALEIATEVDVNHLHEQHLKLLERIKKIPQMANKGLLDVEL